MEKIIEINHATIYQGESLVINQLNLIIEQGELVWLIGKTGSGKSSLLKMLYGDLPLAGGEARVAGFALKNISWKKLPYLRRQLGIVFQDFQLLTDRNVFENLRFVLRATGWKDSAKIKLRIEEVLGSVGLQTKGFKMPHELSGGEQQRVVIARALLNHPKIILADEPTGNLDPETSDEIIKLLFDISKKQRTAILIASHDFLVIQKFPSRTLRCEAGRITENRHSTSSVA
jgi:cell division transport system ATP-binding protein